MEMITQIPDVLYQNCIKPECSFSPTILCRANLSRLQLDGRPISNSAFKIRVMNKSLL